MYKVYNSRVQIFIFKYNKGLHLTPTYHLTTEYPGRFLSVAEKELYVFISSHSDYCNSLYFYYKSMACLQLIHNAATWVLKKL